MRMTRFSYSGEEYPVVPVDCTVVPLAVCVPVSSRFFSCHLQEGPLQVIEVFVSHSLFLELIFAAAWSWFCLIQFGEMIFGGPDFMKCEDLPPTKDHFAPSVDRNPPSAASPPQPAANRLLGLGLSSRRFRRNRQGDCRGCAAEGHQRWRGHCPCRGAEDQGAGVVLVRPGRRGPDQESTEWSCALSR